MPKTKTITLVASVERHATADITVLVTGALLPYHVEPFVDLTNRYAVGDDFMAFGYPEDVFGPEQGRPTPRLFKGHFQRYFEHKSHLGYRYVAGELSVGCPAGLSGGPVFGAWDELHRVYGVVTENFESTTVLEALEQTEAGGQVSRHIYSKVINYGLCVMLPELKDWLDQHAPLETPGG